MAADGEKGAAAAAAEKEVSGRKMITLRSKDRKPFEVSEAAAQLSGVIDEMIKSDCTKGGILLPTIAAETLEKVVKYLNKHAEVAADPYTVVGRDGFRVSADKALKQYAANLVDGLDSHDALFDLILAADYLVIDGLLDAACKKIADMMKGKSPEKIRATFNILDDYSKKEKEEIRREYAWAFPKCRSSYDSDDGSTDTEEEYET